MVGAGETCISGATVSLSITPSVRTQWQPENLHATMHAPVVQQKLAPFFAASGGAVHLEQVYSSLRLQGD